MIFEGCTFGRIFERLTEGKGKMGYSEAFVCAYFDQQEMDNWIINGDENYKKEVLL